MRVVIPRSREKNSTAKMKCYPAVTDTRLMLWVEGLREAKSGLKRLIVISTVSATQGNVQGHRIRNGKEFRCSMKDYSPCRSTHLLGTSLKQGTTDKTVWLYLTTWPRLKWRNGRDRLKNLEEVPILLHSLWFTEEAVGGISTRGKRETYFYCSTRPCERFCFLFIRHQEVRSRKLPRQYCRTADGTEPNYFKAKSIGNHL